MFVKAGRRVLYRRGDLITWLNARRVRAWQRIETTPAEIERWAQALPHATNTGIRTKLTPAVDIDVRDEAVAEQVQQALLNIIGDGGTILQRVGLPPKRLVPFQCDVPFRKISLLARRPRQAREPRRGACRWAAVRRRGHPS